MSDSLRDQLVKSGLASKQKVKDTRKQKSRGQPKQSKSRRDRPEPISEAQHAANVKRERDRALNRQRDATRQREADEKAARELVMANEVAHDGDIAFNFGYGERIKKINITAEQRQELIAGRLAIARTRGHFRLIPRAVAERVQPVAPFLIAFLSDGNEEADPAYEEHPIPDDLLW